MTEILGKTIGEYQVMEFIARGDSSFVYKAFQPTMNRFVAVKILPPSLARNESAVRQFQRQGETMAQLEHPYVLPVYDHGRVNNVTYIASRFVETGTLKDRLPEMFSESETLRLMRQITGALAYLHDRGLVHGNLKPSNILIDENANALLTDLGLAQSSGALTPGNAYMSPEQALGAEIDGRADVYGLGALLFQMVVGEPPPVGVVPNPRSKRPELPEDVEKVILKAMAQYPEQRFQTPAEFMKALEAAFGPKPLPVQPAPIPAPAPVTVGEKPSTEPKVFPAPQLEQKKENSWLIFALGGLAVVILICALSVFLIFFNRPGDEIGAVPPTPEPGVPTITAVADVNVRSGPDVAYEVIGSLSQGQTAEAVGLSADGMWWAINFPASPTGQGWVSDAFVTAEDTENLPVIQGPPPPTPIPPTAEPPTAEPTETPPGPTQPPPEPTQPPPEPTQPPPEPTQPPPEPTQPPPEPTQPPPEPTQPPPEPTQPPEATIPLPTVAPEQPIAPTATSTEAGGGGPGGSICGQAGLAVVGLIGLVRLSRLRRKKRPAGNK
jgi:serine/threonine-protein kinase